MAKRPDNSISISIQDDAEYSAAFKNLHNLYARERELDERIAATPPAAEVRARKREAAAAQLVVGAAESPSPSPATAAEPDLQAMHDELEAVRLAIPRQKKILDDLRKKASRRACEQLLSPYQAVVKRMIKAARDLAEACEAEQAVFDAIEAGDFDWVAPLQRVCLSRSTFSLDPLRDSYHGGVPSPNESPNSEFGRLIDRAREVGAI